MAAYIIVEVEVTDPIKYKQYTDIVPATIAAYGGKFVARGGKTETLEGDWQPGRIVILEFESVERATEWWASEEYSVAKKLRQMSANTKMIVVEGVSA